MPKNSHKKKQLHIEPSYKKRNRVIVQSNGPDLISPDDVALNAVHEYWEAFLEDRGLNGRGDIVQLDEDQSHILVMDRYLYGMAWNDGMIRTEELKHFIWSPVTSDCFEKVDQQDALLEIQRLLMFPVCSVFNWSGYSL